MISINHKHLHLPRALPQSDIWCTFGADYASRIRSPLQGSLCFNTPIPRALPRANIFCTLGANIGTLVATTCPNGAQYVSLGQRPRTNNQPHNPALKGRPNRCRNHSLKTLSTSFSLPKTDTHLSTAKSSQNFTHTLQLFSKPSILQHSSSTPWKIIFTFSSCSTAPSRSPKPSKKLKNLPQSGLKPNPQNSPTSLGNQDTELSPSANPTSKASNHTSKINKNIIGQKRFRRNYASFSPNTKSNLTSVTYGIKSPRAVPWADISCTFGANTRPNRANYASLGQRPRTNHQPHNPALKGRHNPMVLPQPNTSCTFAPITRSNGANYVSLGQRPRTRHYPQTQALKGRHNPMVLPQPNTSYTLTPITRPNGANYTRTTLEFLGTWEKIYNPEFKVVEFDHFKSEAGLPSFVLSPTQGRILSIEL